MRSLKFPVIALLFAMLVLLSGASASGADKPSGGSTVAHAGGLMCFSIAPPRAAAPSCDKLCAAKGGACVGLTTNGAMNPGIDCADTPPPDSGNYVAACRCCAVAHY